MENPLESYWRVRLERLQKRLEANRFEVFIAPGPDEAKELVLRTIVPGTGAATVAWGGSRTFRETGLPRSLREHPGLEFLDPFAPALPLEQSQALRRRAFSADLFITGTNAITEAGQLVNLDRSGNRVAAIAFGPRYVVLLVGRNKVVADLAAAMRRVKEQAAPLVARWLDAETPCATTSLCGDCSAPQRVCNTWGIVEKSYPAGRLKVILINRDLGF